MLTARMYTVHAPGIEVIKTLLCAVQGHLVHADTTEKTARKKLHGERHPKRTLQRYARLTFVPIDEEPGEQWAPPRTTPRL